MVRAAPIVAVLAAGLLLALVPLAAAQQGPNIYGICANQGARGLTAETDLWTGFWQLNTVGRTVFVLGGTRVRGVHARGTFTGAIPFRLWTVRGTFQGRAPMRPDTASSGRFEIKQGLGGRAFTGTWYAKDRDGEEDEGVLRGTYLSGFWQGGWNTNFGHVAFAHPSPKKDKRLVTGRYPWSGGGTIRACVGGANGRLLAGHYRDKTGSGAFTIYLTADMKRFSGSYRSSDGKRSGSWTGTFLRGPAAR